MEKEIKKCSLETKFKDEDGFKHVNEYKLLRRFGKGASAKVLECINTNTNERFAIKIFNKFILRKQKEYVKNRKSGKGMTIKTGIDKILKEISLF